MRLNNTVLIREYAKHGRVRRMLKSMNRCFRLCKRVMLYEKMRTQKLPQSWKIGGTV